VVGLCLRLTELPLGIVTIVLRSLAFDTESNIPTLDVSSRRDEQWAGRRSHPLACLLHRHVDVTVRQYHPPVHRPGLDCFGKCHHGRIEGVASVQLDTFCLVEAPLCGFVVALCVPNT
jgi:hypothetical protein